MPDNTDIRWKQRFQNFEKTIHFLEQALKLQNPDITQKAGTIQFFGLTLELAWNLLKDYLEAQGVLDLKYPRDTIKKAFEVDLISQGHLWLQMLNSRNLSAHTYDEILADQLVRSIKNIYYPLLSTLYHKLKPSV